MTDVDIVANGAGYSSGVSTAALKGMTPSTGTFGDNGLRDNLFPMMRDLLTELGAARGWGGTSSSSLAIGAGSKTFALDQAVTLPVGMTVEATDRGNSANQMWGIITASASGSVTVDVTQTAGSGTIAAWRLAGFAQLAAETLNSANKTGNYTIGATDRRKVNRYTGAGHTFTLTDGATLGTGFATYAANDGASSGSLTVARGSTDTINGATSLALAPGQWALLWYAGSGVWYAIVGGAFTPSTLGTVTGAAADKLVIADNSASNAAALIAATDLPAMMTNGGQLRQITVFLTSGTWTKPAWLKFAVICPLGAGGGGGGCNSPGRTGSGSGGGGGASHKKVAAASLGATETVTIGAAGAAGANTGGDGGTGGTTSFGAHCSATGGVGGKGATATDQAVEGGDGGAGSGGDINLNGQAGGPGISASGTIQVSGPGGSAPWPGGGGARPKAGAGATAAGIDAAANSGGGGSGAVSTGSSGAVGGLGGSGKVVVFEYE